MKTYHLRTLLSARRKHVHETPRFQWLWTHGKLIITRAMDGAELIVRDDTVIEQLTDALDVADTSREQDLILQQFEGQMS